MKIKPSFRVASLVTFFALTASLRATDYNVASQTQLDTAVAAAAPGDNIIVANGSYSGLYLHLTCSGNSSSPITVRAATSGSVTLTGDSRALITGSYLVIRGFVFQSVLPTSASNVIRFSGSNYSRLTQCAFYGCGKDHWIHIVQLNFTSTHNRIDHNYWESLKGQGLGIAENSGSTDNLIDHNRFNGVGAPTQNPSQNNGYEPIQLGQGNYGTEVMRATVEYNLVENMHAVDGADPELISIKSSNNNIRFNTFRGNDVDRDITLRNAHDCTVDGNFVLGSGIRVYGSGHKLINNYVSGSGIDLPGADNSAYPTTTACLIANNSVIDPYQKGIALRTAQGTSINNITIKNNLVQGGVSGSTLYYQQTGITGSVYSANLGYNSGSATVSSGATVAITTNPNLTSDGTVYRLPSGTSPAKSAGSAVTEVVTDMDGQPRTSPLDIGSDEYSALLKPRFPLLASDVGPASTGGPAEEDSTAGTKIAVTGGAVTASANDGNVPANVVDGSLATRWSADGDGQWIRLDLGATYTVTHLKVAVHQGDSRQTGFHAQVSIDGTTWTDVGGSSTRPLVTSGTTLALETYNTIDGSGRYLRLVGHGNTVSTWNSITEIEVYGHSPSLTPIADTYAFGGSPTTNYGTALVLGAKEDGNVSVTYDRVAYIKFSLAGLTFTPTTATLVLTTDSTTAAGTLTVNQCTTDSWVETTLNWNNKPTVGTAIASQSIAAGMVVDVTYDVSSFVNSQFTGDATKLVTLALTGDNAPLYLKSRETGNADAPTLLLSP